MVKSNELVLILVDKKNMPHAVIEVNQKCNINCTACYKDKSDYTKPVELIKKEVEFALTKRNLRAITLAGGEPTLHPQLTEIIEFISSKGIETRILTNGFNFTIDQLILYKKAGLNHILLHVDSLQHRPDSEIVDSEQQLNPLREKIFDMASAAGLGCVVQITLYQKNLVDLVEIVSFILKSEKFNRFLTTNFTDFDKIAYFYNNDIKDFKESDFDSQTVKNKEIEKLLYDKLKMEPYCYIGSNLNSEEKRWLCYMSVAIHKKEGEVKLLHLTPKFKYIIKFFKKIARKQEERVNFLDKHILGRLFIFDAIFAMLFSDLKVLIETMIFLKERLTPGSKMRVKSFIFQQGPTLNTDGSIEYCDNCPDATVKEGCLTVLCLSDVISKEKRIKL